MFMNEVKSNNGERPLVSVLRSGAARLFSGQERGRASECSRNVAGLSFGRNIFNAEY